MGQPAGLHHRDHISMIDPEFVGLFFCVNEVVLWFPGVVLRWVTCPTNEVLLSFVVVVEDSFNFVFFVAFFDVCRQGVYTVPWQVDS